MGRYGLKDGCLTPDQEKQLEQATSIIDKTLKTTVIALNTAAFFEKDPNTKEQLKEAAKIIDTVDVEIVKNLTKIADETCGTCDEIVQAVQDMVQIIEDSLTQINPDWENDPLFEAIVEAIDAILELVSAISQQECRKYGMVYYQKTIVDTVSLGNDSCLTPEQDAKLEKMIYVTEKTLDFASDVLEIVIYFEKNNTIKEQLFEAKEIIDTVNVEVVQNLTKIIDETCGTCDDIVEAVRDMVQIITDSLEQIEPNWAENPVFKLIIKAVNALLDLVQAICDPATTRAPLLLKSDFFEMLMPLKRFKLPTSRLLN